VTREAAEMAALPRKEEKKIENSTLLPVSEQRYRNTLIDRHASSGTAHTGSCPAHVAV
jgi:hypothetical protein